MPRPRLLSDEDIDAAARDVFVAHGPGAPVSLVADELGVTHAALLQRAGSKERLLLRALRPPPRRELDALFAAPPVSGVRDKLLAILRGLRDLLERTLPALLVLRAAGLDVERALGSVEPPPVTVRRRLAGWLVKTRRVHRKRARVLAEALLSTLEAHCFNEHLGGPSFVSKYPSRVLAELIDNFAPELADGRSRR